MLQSIQQPSQGIQKNKVSEKPPSRRDTMSPGGLNDMLQSIQQPSQGIQKKKTPMQPSKRRDTISPGGMNELLADSTKRSVALSHVATAANGTDMKPIRRETISPGGMAALHELSRKIAQEKKESTAANSTSASLSSPNDQSYNKRMTSSFTTQRRDTISPGGMNELLHTVAPARSSAISNTNDRDQLNPRRRRETVSPSGMMDLLKNNSDRIEDRVNTKTKNENKRDTMSPSGLKDLQQMFDDIKSSNKKLSTSMAAAVKKTDGSPIQVISSPSEIQRVLSGERNAFQDTANHNNMSTTGFQSSTKLQQLVSQISDTPPSSIEKRMMKRVSSLKLDVSEIINLFTILGIKKLSQCKEII